MSSATRLRKLGLLERFHSTRNYLGHDSCVVASAQYTSQDGTTLSKDTLFPALRMLIETHAPLGVKIQGDEATADVYLVRLPTIDLSRIVVFSAKDSAHLQEAYESHLSRGFQTQGELPLWRVEVLADNTVIFAVHHTIADGLSSMAFHLHLFRALQKTDSVADASDIVHVPTDNAYLPPVDKATDVRPSFGTIFNAACSLLAPTSWTKLGSAWTGLPSPSIPDLTTHVRFLSFPAEQITALTKAARNHKATLTAALYVLLVSVASRLIADSGVEGKQYKRIGACVALSMHGVAGVPNDVMCDYASIFRGYPRLASEFSWIEAARVAKILQEQKRKGRETVGTLYLLFGNHIGYLKSHLSGKREGAFALSNLGRVEQPDVEGKWSMGRTAFAQCDVVTGCAFYVNVAGDPSGGINCTFTWGKSSVDVAFIEQLIKGAQESVAEII
ncbi:alcohol acetyltransferase [Favolaschia claudopus]|uniref:Alcohol acetyltransferase n=1 Tax=Favolaschia claudopus TaxID=2862362 RepID=A0AAW0DJH6_9AGAR